jgi:CRP-like cAMP-binding protein
LCGPIFSCPTRHPKRHNALFLPTAIVFQQEADGAVQAVCYANLVMSTTLPIPLSASLTAERRELLFPTLSAAQIERIAAHGKRRRVSAGEILVEQGDQNLPFFVVISGAIESCAQMATRKS